MRSARHILLLLLAFLLQTTWLHALVVYEVKPDLVLLALVFVALDAGDLEAIALGFAVGFLQDLHTPADLGLNTLLKSLVGFAITYGRSDIAADRIQVQLALLLGVVLVHDLLFFAASRDVALAQVPYFWIRYGVPQALYTCVLGAIVSGLLMLRGAVRT